MKDGEVAHFGLSDRFAGAPIVVMDSASAFSQSQGQAQGQGQLTDEQRAEIAWFEMSKWLGDAWQSPAPQAARPVISDQRPLARDQAAWANSGSPPVVHAPAGSGQVLQDDGSPQSAHERMIHDLENSWRNPSR